MKILMLFLGVMLYSFSMVDVAYAGNLNEHELAIIEAAGEVYQYNGESYRVEDIYIDKLTTYLSRDDIDISAGDKDLIIQIAYANIEKGVIDGYLKPTDEANAQEDHEDKGREIDMEESVKEILETVGMDISDIESHIPSLIAGSDITMRIEEASNISDDEANTDTRDDISGIDTIHNQEDIATIGNIDNNSDMDSNHDALVDKDIKTSMGEEIIKETGFYLDRTLYIMIGLGLLMIIGIFIAIRNNYFNHAYE